MSVDPDEHLRAGLELLAQLEVGTAPEVVTQLHLLASIAESVHHLRPASVAAPAPAAGASEGTEEHDQVVPEVADMAAAVRRLGVQLQPVVEAVDLAGVVVEEMADPVDRWRYLGELARFVRDLAESLEVRRAQVAVDLQEAEDLNVDEVARRLGVDRSQAHRLLQTARNRTPVTS